MFYNVDFSKALYELMAQIVFLLNHNLFKKGCIHCLEYLIFEMACLLPQTCWNEHFAHWIPVCFHILQNKLFHNCFWIAIRYGVNKNFIGFLLWFLSEKAHWQETLKLPIGIAIIHWYTIYHETKWEGSMLLKIIIFIPKVNSFDF